MNTDEGTHYLSHMYDPLITETAPSIHKTVKVSNIFIGFEKWKSSQ